MSQRSEYRVAHGIKNAPLGLAIQIITFLRRSMAAEVLAPIIRHSWNTILYLQHSLSVQALMQSNHGSPADRISGVSHMKYTVDYNIFKYLR